MIFDRSEVAFLCSDVEHGFKVVKAGTRVFVIKHRIRSGKDPHTIYLVTPKRKHYGDAKFWVRDSEITTPDGWAQRLLLT